MAPTSGGEEVTGGQVLAVSKVEPRGAVGHAAPWSGTLTREERSQHVLRQAKCRSWLRGKAGVEFLRR